MSRGRAALDQRGRKNWLTNLMVSPRRHLPDQTGLAACLSQG